MKISDSAIVLLLVVLVIAAGATARLTDQNVALSNEVTRLKVKLAEQPTSAEVDRQCSQWLMNSDILKARDRICAGVVQRLNKKGK
jgi:hypothetical protein